MEAAQKFLNTVKTEIVNPIITLLALASFVLFVWGVVLFIRSAGDQEQRATGQKHMLWGIIGLTIVFGAGAIVNILASVWK